MGMSASQTRVLMLTARQNDLEYQAQQILSAKLSASRQAEDAAAAYEEKISNTHFITKDKNAEGDKIEIAVTSDKMMDCRKYLVNSAGQVVLPSEGKYSYYNYTNGHAPTGEAWNIGLNSYSESNFVEDSNLDASNEDAAQYLKDKVESGEYRVCYMPDTEPEKVEHKFTTIQATGSFTETYYTADDAAAEAKYKTITQKLETLEKKLDMQMEQIETERSAVKTEKESVEKVVDENVESTFKTFG